MQGKDLSTPHAAPLAHVVDRNIEAMLARRREAEQARGAGDRIADAVTGFAGSMRFVYVHLVVYGAWAAVNLGLVPGVPRFDPTFVILATVASVESIFLSTFILISQNRMVAAQNQRADLDLHVSLLAEHEVTRLITLVQAMSERMGIPEASDPELGELARDVAPEKVLDEIDEYERQSASSEPA